VEDLTSNGLDLRAKAIIALLAWGGLRRAEVAALGWWACSMAMTRQVVLDPPPGVENPERKRLTKSRW